MDRAGLPATLPARRRLRQDSRRRAAGVGVAAGARRAGGGLGLIDVLLELD